jgi:hypothetical protein
MQGVFLTGFGNVFIDVIESYCIDALESTAMLNTEVFPVDTLVAVLV